MPDQPTILVKKADGTQVRMTMDEFKIYVRTTKNTKVRNDEQKIEEKKEETEKLGNLETEKLEEAERIKETKEIKKLPVIKKSEALATSTPVTEIFVAEAKAKLAEKKSEPAKPKRWTEEDYKSLLEEQKVETNSDLPILPDKQDPKLIKILTELNWQLPENLQSRLRSLVLSKLKDIRTDEQVREYALRGVGQGGLGLSEEQVGQLLTVIARSTGGKIEQVRKDINDKMINHKKIDAETKIKETGLPVDETGKLRNWDSDFVNSVQPRVARPVMHDVTTPISKSLSDSTTKQSVGPVDEFAQFSLIDFRRLANDPAEAVKIMLNKLQVLREESFLLYQEALSAWQKSPLYREYQEILGECLRTRQKVDDYLRTGGTSQLKKEEFDSIIRFNNELI